MLVLTPAPFLTFPISFPFVALKLVLASALVVTFPLCFFLESDATSLLFDSLADLLEEGLVATLLVINGFAALAAPLDVDGVADVAMPLDVDGVDDVAVCPSSTKLMSSGETCVLSPKDHVGCLKIRIYVYPPKTK